MSLYTVSSESSACCSPSNENRAFESVISGTKGHSIPRPLVRLHSNNSDKPEVASVTVRAVSADYSQQMQALRDRTSALERYKMLVNKARLTPVKKRNAVTEQSTPLSSESLNRTGTKTTMSKQNDTAIAATVKHRIDFSSTDNDRYPSTVHEEGVRGGAPLNTADSNLADEHLLKAASQAKDDDIYDPSNDDKKRACVSDGEPNTSIDHEHIQAAPSMQLPILPEPIGLPSNPNRDSMRPDYEPITSRHVHEKTQSLDSSSLLCKSNVHLEAQSTTSTPENPRPSTDDQPPDQNACPPHTDMEPQSAPKPLKSNRNAEVKQQMTRKSIKDERSNPLHLVGPNEDRISGNGSQTAFWIRPSSALYEMTASIGAKRKDSARLEAPSEAVSVERARVRASRVSKGVPEPAPHDPRPPFTTFFTSHNHTARLSARSSARVTSRGVSPTHEQPPSHLRLSRRNSVRLTTDPPLSPAALNLSFSSDLASRKNSMDTGSNLKPSTHRRRPATSTSHESSLVLPPPPEGAHRPAGTPQEKGRGKDTRSGKASAAAKLPLSARKQNKASPGAMQRKHSVSFDTSFSETPEPTTDPVPDGLSPKATPQSTSSSRVASARSSLSAASGKGKLNHSAKTPISVPKSLAFVRQDTTTTLDSFLIKDGNQNVNITSVAKNGTEVAKSKHLDRSCTSHYLAAEDPSAMEMDKENICEENVYASHHKHHYQGYHSALGTPPLPSASEMVGSMLQGIVQQTRRVLPCYLCADMVNARTYHVHMEFCRKLTEVLMEEHAVPKRAWEAVEKISHKPVPNSSSPQEERDEFAVECYKCALELVISCRTCGTSIRIHDAKEHEMLCGKSSYSNSKAAQRVRRAADHILSHATDVQQ